MRKKACMTKLNQAKPTVMYTKDFKTKLHYSQRVLGKPCTVHQCGHTVNTMDVNFAFDSLIPIDPLVGLKLFESLTL